jgi:hypothetical protein
MPAVLLALALAGAYLAIAPPSADLAAQLYRVDLVDRAGLALWDDGWYGGHHLLGYSVLVPPAGWLVGARVLGALAIVAGTAAFAPLVRSRGAASWFAAGMAAAVVSGRLAFAVGAAVATAATLASARGRTALAVLGGAATSLASPVAGLFLVLVAVAGRRWAMAVAAIAVGGALAVAFPEGGSEPFVASAFWPALAATLTALGLLTAFRAPGGGPDDASISGASVGERGALRAGLALYALLLVAAFALRTPLGGNAARLGALLGGPLAVALLSRRALAIAALPLAYWTLYPAIRDWSQATGDPSTKASYYAPLLTELQRRTASLPPARVEVPFTARHWESYEVGRRFPLARGWERQLDREDDALFYGARLTAGRYRAWLDELAVRWVALPDAALDPSSREEARLVRDGLPFLRQVWRGRHWRLYEVRGATALGATALTTQGFTARSGLVRVRWSRYWAVVGGRGCVGRAPGGWTTVASSAPGAQVRVGMRFALGRVFASGPRCR